MLMGTELFVGELGESECEAVQECNAKITPLPQLQI